MFDRGTPITTVRLWRDHDGLIAEITDPVALSDPLSGRRPPTGLPTPGRGLWLIHQLCDLVETRATDHGVIHRLDLRTP